MRVPSPRVSRSRLAAALLLAGLVGPQALMPPARGELPPAVYAQQQRQAPLLLELEVLAVQRWPALRPERLLVQARVLRVLRQPRGIRLRPGDPLRLSYELPPQRPSGWVGPAPLPILQPGERRPAWLGPDPARPGWFRPVAAGRSFGPSLESLPAETP